MQTLASEAGKKRKQAIHDAQQRFEERKRQKRGKGDQNIERSVKIYDESRVINYERLAKSFLTNDQVR